MGRLKRIVPPTSALLKTLMRTSRIWKIAHLKKYKTATEKMIQSLKLVRTAPIMLGAKPK
jgi:hypothetical protein